MIFLFERNFVTGGYSNLGKDFIIDEKQIVRSRNAGATVILLIVAALPEARLKELTILRQALA